MSTPLIMAVDIAGALMLLVLTVVFAGLFKLLISLLRRMGWGDALDVVFSVIAALAVVLVMLWVLLMWTLVFGENFRGWDWPA